MSRSNPAKALNGVQTGHICDQCNKDVRTGNLVRAYATAHRDRWVLRRVWCDECGETTLREETDGVDEVMVEAIFWDYRLVSVEVKAASTR